jgi:hypothetical protein
MYFHEWRDQLKGTQKLDEHKHFAKELRTKFNGQGPTRPYCKGLVEFYHACEA